MLTCVTIAVSFIHRNRTGFYRIKSRLYICILYTVDDVFSLDIWFRFVGSIFVSFVLTSDLWTSLKVTILVKVFYQFFSGLLYHATDRFLYHPDQPTTSRVYVPSPATFGLPFENLYIRSKVCYGIDDVINVKEKAIDCFFCKKSKYEGWTSCNIGNDSLPYLLSFLSCQDSTRIHMFFIKCPGVPAEVSPMLPTILFLHGNAGNIGHRLANVHGLVKHLGCNVCLVT